MSKVLIINPVLVMGGGEKLMYELLSFYRSKGHSVEVLITDINNKEYYDAVFEKENVKYAKAPIDKLSQLRHPFHIAKVLLWRARLKFANRLYAAVHLINLANSARLIGIVNSSRRYFWHIENEIQFPGRVYPFPPELFQNSEDTLVLLNRYQLKELQRQYQHISCKIKMFKLFLQDADDNGHS